jgi:carbon monoxide dehydrogenase subunit G
MTLDGTHHFDAPRDRVWAAFNDPAVLARATPGCERLEPVGPDEFDATLSVGIASVKGTYQGKLAILDKKPLEG